MRTQHVTVSGCCTPRFQNGWLAHPTCQATDRSSTNQKESFEPLTNKMVKRPTAAVQLKKAPALRQTKKPRSWSEQLQTGQYTEEGDTKRRRARCAKEVRHRGACDQSLGAMSHRNRRPERVAGKSKQKTKQTKTKLYKNKNKNKNKSHRLSPRRWSVQSWILMLPSLYAITHRPPSGDSSEYG
jgi:hypothetical protein